jgi:hypothetical protein
MVAETKLYYYSEVLNDDLLDRFAPTGEMGIIADFAITKILGFKCKSVNIAGNREQGIELKVMRVYSFLGKFCISFNCIPL